MDNLQQQAAELAGLNPIKSARSLDACRDVVDALTGGELDCTQLDILTDMAWKRAQGGFEIAARPECEARGEAAILRRTAPTSVTLWDE